MTPPGAETAGSDDAAALTIRKLLARGAAWILAATFVRHALRLASSLILTRILAPEAFGIVATASLLSVAIDMCSDFGIRQAMVHNPDGGSRDYVAVAWTLTAVRGLGLAALIVALAGPFAAACGDERLQGIAMLTAINSVLQGVCSPGRLLWMRELRQDKITQLELGVDVARLPANILGVLLWRDAYGLAVAGIATEIVRVVLSYVMSPGWPVFSWDREIVRRLARYGRFVFLASVLGFLAGRLDSLFVARFLGMELAGIYYVAAALTAPVETLGSQLLAGLLFPLLAKSQGDPKLIRRRMWRVLRFMLFVALPLTLFVILVGPWMIGILYDRRYEAAVGAFQWLMAAGFLSCLGTALNCPLMATGRPHWGTIATFVRLVVFCGGAAILGSGGVSGYAAAIAASTLAFVLTIAFAPWTVAARDAHVKTLAP